MASKKKSLPYLENGCIRFLQKEMNFINLTNGIQAIEDYNLKNYRFIRIQSTWCEQKAWDRILFVLSDEFLLYAALGEPCIVYDYGARKEVPRAIWQGLEFIKFALSKRWYDITYIPKGRAVHSLGYFKEQYKKLSKPTKNKLDYFKKYTTGRSLRISAVASATDKDGSGWHQKMIKRKFDNEMAQILSRSRV